MSVPTDLRNQICAELDRAEIDYDRNRMWTNSGGYLGEVYQTSPQVVETLLVVLRSRNNDPLRNTALDQNRSERMSFGDVFGEVFEIVRGAADVDGDDEESDGEGSDSRAGEQEHGNDVEDVGIPGGEVPGPDLAGGLQDLSVWDYGDPQAAVVHEALTAALIEERDSDDDVPRKDIDPVDAEMEAEIDELADNLSEHYKKEEQMQQAFRSSMLQFAQEHSASHETFRNHILHAHVATWTSVRAWNIVRWYTRIPHYVRMPLRDLIWYYHKEAKLRSELLHAEGRCNADHSGNEEEYAVDRGEFGNERGYGLYQDGPQQYLPQASGRQQILHLIASLNVRKTWIEQASLEIRFPLQPFDLSVDGKFLFWMQQADFVISTQGIKQAHTLTDADKKQVRQVLRVMARYRKRIQDRYAALDPFWIAARNAFVELENLKTVLARLDTGEEEASPSEIQKAREQKSAAELACAKANKDLQAATEERTRAHGNW